MLRHFVLRFTCCITLNLNRDAFENGCRITNIWVSNHWPLNAKKLGLLYIAGIETHESVLRDLDLKNSGALICGNFNINIVKINDETHFCDFVDTMLACSFYKKNTFPTHLNDSSGATLIDSIYCRLSSRCVKTTSGISTDPLSDHFPYFMWLDMVTMNPVKSLKKKKYVNHQSALANILSEMTTRD